MICRQNTSFTRNNHHLINNMCCVCVCDKSRFNERTLRRLLVEVDSIAVNKLLAREG